MRQIVRFVTTVCLTAVIGVLGGCFSVPLPGPFEGRVTDSQSGSPIAGAQVEAESWCHDNPMPDGPGNFYVRSITITDERGFFRLKKETRRGGLFGCSFALKITAEGYIPTNLLYEPKGVPLPPGTKAYPFIHTSTFKKLPANLEVQLTPALPVLLMAIKSGNPMYQRTAREKLTKLIGVDYGYEADKWEKAVASKEKGGVELPVKESRPERQGCSCPESVGKHRQPRDVRRKIEGLLRAAASGDVKEVQDILRSGVDCNARTRNCVTALMEAANRGHLDLVEFLLSKGAEVNAQDKKCRTALIKATSSYNSTQVVKKLLAHGADVNLSDQDGLTALMTASMFGYKEMVAMLLADGALVNLKDKDGETALFKASVINSEEVIALLKAHGANE